MPPGTLEQQMFDLVVGALVRVDRRIAKRRVDPETSVVDDLGLESIRFVDLALALEDALGINEFPLQEWYDNESRADKRFTVRSLVALCLELMKTPS